ncbi:DUF4433 domain-containing protein [Pseudomonas sp. TKO26]|nr:DUF4433 domain-containing protein [Pseudomonas sp. TKO30]PYY90008.1 DUF4433 domain-containing protein [Pseudomonas sp. TKO29]PYY93096.1 DUF4433 domain-containing protein [Pseudomonas sp. TKO26]PYZ00226.1 DUF4433 domain-containing protein [Pseudomonas sp. TKO14]
MPTDRQKTFSKSEEGGSGVRRDLSRPPDAPRKMERYQAEALIHNYLPITGLLGIMCYSDAMKKRIEQDLAARGLALSVHARPGWYFQ